MYLGLTLSGESTYFGKLNFPTLDVYDKTNLNLEFPLSPFVFHMHRG